MLSASCNARRRGESEAGAELLELPQCLTRVSDAGEVRSAQLLHDGAIVGAGDLMVLAVAEAGGEDVLGEVDEGLRGEVGAQQHALAAEVDPPRFAWSAASSTASANSGCFLTHARQVETGMPSSRLISGALFPAAPSASTLAQYAGSHLQRSGFVAGAASAFCRRFASAFGFDMVWLSNNKEKGPKAPEGSVDRH